MAKKSSRDVARPCSPARDILSHRSAMVMRSVDDILEPAPARLELGKWAVLAVMLLLMMMPIVYLAVIGPVARQPAPITEADAVRERAAALPPEREHAAWPVMARDEPHAAAIIESALRHGGLDLTWAADREDAAPPPAVLKLDSKWNPKKKNTVTKKPFTRVAQAHQRKSAEASAADLRARERTAENDVAPTPAGIQDNPVAIAKTSAMKTAYPAESNRDIVVRRPSDSTGALVGRCRELGLIEGELCRMRICSGMWGMDPACSAGTEAMAGAQAGEK